jgi:NAD(P) transhydrogenase subunit alpha
MKIGIPREIHEGERRIATTPAVVSDLRQLGYAVQIEAGAGAAASFTDDAFRQAGAELVADPRALWQSSDIILKVRPPERHPSLGVEEAEWLREGHVLICFLWPAQRSELLQYLARKGVTTLAMDSVPRISRAQKMDALSSMANIAGYRAVVEAAQHFGRFFTGQITAAGRIPPAKVLVIGAGVAGLAAIGAARSLGAVVRAFDTRPEVKEQVESMSGEFLELDFKEEGSGQGGYAKVMSPEFIAAEMALFAAQAKDVDIIITTALIPGKPAPKLITGEMAASMAPGSVIVDLAAEQGGNCEWTVPGEVVTRGGVTIIGYTDLPSRLATQSSQLYATNLRHLIADMTPAKDGMLVVDFDDEVVRGATVVKGHEITWPPPAPRLSAEPVKPAPAGAQGVSGPHAAGSAAPRPAGSPSQGTPRDGAAGHGPDRSRVASKPTRSAAGPIVAALAGAAALAAVGAYAPPVFLGHFTVFVLACFVGYMVVWNVTPALHTPLMSVTNAISSIIILGGVLQISSVDSAIVWIAGATILLTSINIAGGFAVTARMLEMFRK